MHVPYPVTDHSGRRSQPGDYDDANAARIAIEGMTEGWFTRRMFSDYLPGDYVNARRIINGTDRAQMIAGYARTFEQALG